MTKLVWNRLGDRVYESGLDKGVLYLPDGSAVPWNGLTSVIEKFDVDSTPVYYDGMKISNLISLGSFFASLKAVTYPDEFLTLENLGRQRRGVFYGDQSPKSFGLCYRTLIGDDLEGESKGYKIHILYNLTVVPSEKTYASLSNEPSLVEFEWEIQAVPEEVSGFRPTAHIILDSRQIDPYLMEELEAMLYGDSFSDAALLPLSDLTVYIRDWYRIKIVDNGDGTWTATSARDEFIRIDIIEQYFEILGANAVYLDEYTFVISDTYDISDVPQIKVVDNGDGTWTASSDHADLIVIDENQEFEIRNATATWLNPDTYRLSDTIE